MKVVITGTTRGLGKLLAHHFVNNGDQVVELNRNDDKITPAVGCDLYINNAYGDGMQIGLFNQLYASVDKMIVMGSIAAYYPDPDMLLYSQHKRELKDRVLDVANGIENKADILLLELTGESYNDAGLVIRTISFWLENSKINRISFIPGEPNK